MDRYTETEPKCSLKILSHMSSVAVAVITHHNCSLHSLCFSDGPTAFK
jgi:hypothetical protein